MYRLGGSYDAYKLSPRPFATRLAARLTDAFRSVGHTRRGTASWSATSGMSSSVRGYGSGPVPTSFSVTGRSVAGDEPQ
jgi:hypothetical protein